MGIGELGLEFTDDKSVGYIHSNINDISTSKVNIIEQNQKKVLGIIDYLPENVVGDIPDIFSEEDKHNGSSDFKFYEHTKKQLSRELNIQVQSVLSSIKNEGPILSDSQSEILKKGLFGYEVLDGNYIERIISLNNIEAALKSYYRKKALIAFEKFTKELGMKYILRRSYDVNEDAHKIYNEINGDYNLLKESELESEVITKIQQKYENAIDSLTDKEKEYLYIASHDLLIGYAFDICITHIKQMSDKLCYTFIKFADEEKKDFFKKMTANLFMEILNIDIS